jgi:hypothetical protein
MTNENDSTSPTLSHGAQVQQERGASPVTIIKEGAVPMAFVPSPTVGPQGAGPASDNTPTASASTE